MVSFLLFNRIDDVCISGAARPTKLNLFAHGLSSAQEKPLKWSFYLRSGRIVPPWYANMDTRGRIYGKREVESFEQDNVSTEYFRAS